MKNQLTDLKVISTLRRHRANTGQAKALVGIHASLLFFVN